MCSEVRPLPCSRDCPKNRLIAPRSRDELRRSLAEELAGDLLANGDRSGDVGRAASEEPRRAVGAEDDGFKDEAIPLYASPSADGRQATGSQFKEQRPFSQHGLMRAKMIERLQQPAGRRIFDPRFDPERSLANGREHGCMRDDRRNSVGQAKSLESRLGEHNRVVLSFVKFPQPRFNIAADVFHDQIRPQMQKLCLAAEAAGADASCWRQILDARRFC